MVAFASLNIHRVASIASKQGPTDPKSWNSIIKRHAKLKDDCAILFTFTQMEEQGFLPDNSTLPLVLKACGRLQAVERGRKIHSEIGGTNLIDDVRIQTALVGFYCKCGLPEDALYVFDGISERDTVCWNAIMSGLVGSSCYEEALLLFMEMQQEYLRPNTVTVVALVSACGELRQLRLGKELHGYCLRNGLLDCNAHVGTALTGFYSRFNVGIARNVFEMMGLRNTVSWNTMISGYLDAGDSLRALDLFMKMMIDGFECDSITMLTVIQACSEVGSLKLGMQIHQLAVKYYFTVDLFILNALLNMYGKIGNLASSLKLFESTPTKDTALWNSIIYVNVEHGFLEKAICLFTRMRLSDIQEDERTIAVFLSSCVYLDSGLRMGKSLHAHSIKIGIENVTSLQRALLSMYAEQDCVLDAFMFFDDIKDSDVISWNTLISTLVRNGLRGQAWELFEQMHQSDINPNSHTVVSILAACDDESFLNAGRSIHGYVVKHGIGINPSLNTALTEMYMNCNNESTARRLFESFHDKDLISWNSLIASYIKNDQAHKALLLFHRMLLEVEPNSVTIINVLSSCTHMANLPEGQCLHAYTIRRASSLGFDLSLGNAFLTMYARCGSIQYAEKIFKILPRKNIVTWNAMIDGYGMHGLGHHAMLTFSQMLEHGFRPNAITFVSALSACSHSGLVEKGLQLFYSMVQDFFLIPELVHYGCVVDLLGRSGRLDEARKFISAMPIAPDASIWRALLSACRVYSETKLAKTTFEKLIELEPTNAGNYILLSNIYAAAGRWSEVRNLRMQLEEKGLKKPPGKSWIVVRSKVHYFTAGDRSHHQSHKIYTELRSLLSSIRKHGYVPDLRWVLHEEEEEVKLRRLFSHSEKLAIAFGLISVRGGTPILIGKNLRVCGDCHEFGKHVSKLVGREIVIRDNSRFHHFVNGFCLCKDYW
ncbi:putative pentatricopeptide repeat-containing protein At3g13770, mitochondrial [Diospyros lotus]|uniref:putative pentatricopeptide repeat-containing protein At3g13770, mitochondrial n=1 Tax=Diospyros lotus TaxID=55363 RepID=UPI00225A3BE5|nr:putative pentatricopeptide repeat-containing protein At3g13770, mitochondrial [Diospyros lotus]XP_052185014.1 putative pentatricopeptide repeat-containing protein At3g13770, mitochondrial [Diospyros lotus]XP_052185091.1 putative pentatricopeptide repeat-containing protein At3g13770, mitochondrial [Diospyros lotus]